MIFKMYDCDFGIVLNGVTYNFEHVDNFTIEDPENTRLIRGSNAANKVGLVYKEGIKEPKTVTVTLVGVSAELHGVLVTAYNDKSRMDVFSVNRLDGSSKIGKNSVLTQYPQQMTLDDSAESMNVALVFNTFDMTEAHKS